MIDRRRAIALALIVVASLARLAIAAPWSGRPLDDPDNYLPLARSLADGRGFCLDDGRPTAYRPPLYPIILAPLTRLGPVGMTWSIAGLHAALGALTVGATLATARRWGLSPRRAGLAGLIVALDPVLVAQSRAVMTETLAAALLALALLALGAAERLRIRDILAGGVALGLAGLCRPSTLPIVALAVPTIGLFGPTRPGGRLGAASLLGMIVLLVMAPWALRNAVRFGEPVWTTTHGGYTLALANNPAYYRDVLDGPPGAVWSGPGQRAWFEQITDETAGLGEPEADRYLARAGWRMLRERPADFLRASLARLGRFWGPAPSGTPYGPTLRGATAAWTLPIWAALALGVSNPRAWRRPRIIAIIMLVSLTFVHAFYWTDLRMRAPIVPAIALLAASGRRPPQMSNFGRNRVDSRPEK